MEHQAEQSKKAPATFPSALSAGRPPASCAPAPIPSFHYLVKFGPGLKIQPGSSRSQLTRRAKRPSPQLEICKNIGAPR
eukprot:15469035-Alexandrium_andersonii.AAC.1